MFAYNPMEDKLLPCPEVGLAFEYGDVLKVRPAADLTRGGRKAAYANWHSGQGGLSSYDRDGMLSMYFFGKLPSYVASVSYLFDIKAPSSKQNSYTKTLMGTRSYPHPSHNALPSS